MPRIDKWVPFFEESSQRRDVTSWWSRIQERVLSWGMQVRLLVSDRARALVKLGKAGYLNVCSMPDLFHYMQDLSKAVGCRIGRQLQQAQKVFNEASADVKEKAKAQLATIQQVYDAYREQIEQINQLIHPFNKQDEWTSASVIESELLRCFTKIGKIAEQLGIEIALDKAQKVLAQITPIAQGVQSWIAFTQADLDKWQSQQIISEGQKKWLIKFAIPYVYWQIQLNRTQAKARNKSLRAYYKKRISYAKEQLENSELLQQLSEEELKILMNLAYQIAISFQRASSQTEGRNGYLAFVNHAHRGMSNERLKVLTVIHNYDIRRQDGTTPAQRLFGREFPDIFEFLYQNVTGFKEPRKRNRNSLKVNILQL